LIILTILREEYKLFLLLLLLILWQAPDTQIDTAMQQLAINSASIPRQRLGKRLRVKE
jgi:hypothetical protein